MISTSNDFASFRNILVLGIISDYADLTEIISRRIKQFYENILQSKRVQMKRPGFNNDT
jgi:hypothetical protein